MHRVVDPVQHTSLKFHFIQHVAGIFKRFETFIKKKHYYIDWGCFVIYFGSDSFHGKFHRISVSVKNFVRHSQSPLFF